MLWPIEEGFEGQEDSFVGFGAWECENPIKTGIGKSAESCDIFTGREEAVREGSDFESRD